MKLEKAKLQEITADKNAKPIGSPVDVQFNPTTLKLQLSSNLSTGDSTGSQTRQSSGSTSSTLSFDLVFDTADEGETEQPRSVLEKVAAVQKFVTPKAAGSKSKQKPPKLRFIWGDFNFDGVVESINIDLDLFAANGTPLRAKVALSIKGQDPKLIFGEVGAGANKQGNAPTPLQKGSATPGSSGGPVDRVAPALGGESLPEFAARNGLDPSAWRGLSTAFGVLGAGLALGAGVEVGFSADLSIGGGIGVSVGVEAGISASLEASFGLESSVTAGVVAGVGASADLAAGFAVASAGGVTAAIESVKDAKNNAAEQKAREAFGAPVTVPAPAGPSAPSQSRTPLKDTGIPSAATQAAALSAPAQPRADTRASTFGFGVPLRPTFSEAVVLRNGTVTGNLALAEATGSTLPPIAVDPTTPPWIALPARDAGRAAADKTQALIHPARLCGCTGRCGHRKKL